MSIVHKIFGQTLKFTDGPSDATGKCTGVKPRKKTNAGSMAKTRGKLSMAVVKSPKKKGTNLNLDVKPAAKGNAKARKVKAKVQVTPADSKSRTKGSNWIQAHQVDWFTRSGVENALSVSHSEMDLEGRDYEELVKILLHEFPPRKIGMAYALLGPKCNVVIEDVGLDKDFHTKVKAVMMFKDMVMNHHNMIRGENTIEFNSSGDEDVVEISRNK